MNTSELTKLCGSFFSNPIDNFKKEGVLPKAVGAAKILAYITLVIPLGVGLIYGASHGYDTWKNRSIQQNAPNLEKMDMKIRESVGDLFEDSDLMDTRVSEEIAIFEKLLDERAKEIMNYTNKMEESTSQFQELNNSPKLMLKSLGQINEGIIETLVDKIYLDNPKEIQTFVKEVKNLIEDLTSKVKNKQLTVKEQESLPLLINNLNQVILNIHKKEISLFNEKIGGQLGLLNDTLNLLGPIPSSSKDMDLFLNRWNFS